MDKWLSHPTALKVLSVVIALLLWAVVHFDPESTPAKVTSNIDTKVIEAAEIIPIGLDEENYALFKLEPTVVRIVVEGRRANLLAAKPEDYIVQADLTGIKEGEHIVPLTYKMPSGISVVEISPQTVTVDIEEIQTKAFDLAVITTGTPANGYITGTPSFVDESNSQVKVTLPKEEMVHVGSVSTTVSVEGAEKSIVDKKARVVVYDTEGKVMEHAATSPSTVEVEVPVTPPFKMLPLQLSFTGRPPDGLSVSSVKAELDKVAVYGDQELLDQLTSYSGVTIDLSKLKKSGTVKAKVSTVSGAKLVEPTEINVEVTLVASESKLLDIPIKLTGLADGLRAKVSQPEGGILTLSVDGAPNVLASLQKADVELVADLSGLEPGQHSVKLTADLPTFVDLTADSTDDLTVTIEIEDDSTPTGTGPDGSGSSNGGQVTQPPTATPPKEEEPDDGTDNGSESTPGNNGTGTGSESNSGNEAESTNGSEGANGA